MAGLLSVTAAALLLSGCGTAAAVWPLRRGQALASIEVGGPVANLSGAQFPLPYTVGRCRLPIADRLNVYASVHPLMPVFGAVAGDAGLGWFFVEQDGWRPCLGASAGAIGFAEVDGGRGSLLLTQLELTASYLRPGLSLSYFGVNTTYQFGDRFLMTYSPYVGHNFRLRENLSLDVEVKWYSGYERTQPRPIKYTMPLANHGAIGFVAGINWHFGGWYR
jgi:hypothetical protein